MEEEKGREQKKVEDGAGMRPSPGMFVDRK